MRMGNVGVTLAIFASLFAASGCIWVPTNPRVPTSESGVTTKYVDANDYQLAADAIVQKILKGHRFPEGAVVAQGGVDTKGTPYSVDVKLIQDRIAAKLSEEGRLRITFAVDATKGNTAAEKIYDVLLFNWMKDQKFDPQHVQTLGKLASIDAILFGRVSSIERRLPGGGVEITYAFSWKLVSTTTGLDICLPFYPLRKNVR